MEGVLSHHALQVVSQHALQQVSGGALVSQHALQVSRPHPRGKFSGIWSRPTPKGEVEGDLAGGVCSGGCLLQGGACSRGLCLLQGGACSGGCLLQVGCGDPPMMATAAGSTHPTGMHSCFVFFWKLWQNIVLALPSPPLLLKRILDPPFHFTIKRQRFIKILYKFCSQYKV